MPRYKIADIVFSVELNYNYTKILCKDYEYFGQEKDAFSCKPTMQEILSEKQKMPDYPEPFLEGLVVFRKLCDYALENANGIIFHCSAVMVDNEAYLFTAPSGTGKSTHARLWRELLGDKAVMINDDKPIIRKIDNEFYVYGTPWKGKHDLGTNQRAKIKAICKIYQAKENKIERIDAGEMILTILNQTVRPTEENKFDKLLSLLDELLKSVNIYSLGCNISEQAAQLSYNTMKRG